ncbi:MAG: hypothetical protein AABX71_02655 [Nanoarchaeota archaeon]
MLGPAELTSEEQKQLEGKLLAFQRQLKVKRDAGEELSEPEEKFLFYMGGVRPKYSPRTRQSTDLIMLKAIERNGEPIAYHADSCGCVNLNSSYGESDTRKRLTL